MEFCVCFASVSMYTCILKNEPYREDGHIYVHVIKTKKKESL